MTGMKEQRAAIALSIGFLKVNPKLDTRRVIDMSRSQNLASAISFRALGGPRLLDPNKVDFRFTKLLSRHLRPHALDVGIARLIVGYSEGARVILGQ
eukprot:9473619-Pyramimonas_sp.AAC.1